MLILAAVAATFLSNTTLHNKENLAYKIGNLQYKYTEVAQYFSYYPLTLAIFTLLLLKKTQFFFTALHKNSI